MGRSLGLFDSPHRHEEGSCTVKKKDKEVDNDLPLRAGEMVKVIYTSSCFRSPRIDGKSRGPAERVSSLVGQVKSGRIGLLVCPAPMVGDDALVLFTGKDTILGWLEGTRLKRIPT